MKLPGLIHGFLTPAFLRYLLVGGFGFVLDAGGMEILYHLGLDIHAARALSMTVAIGCTYLFHRYYTFTDSARPAKSGAQFAAFGAVQLAAAALNYGLFCAVLWLQPRFLPTPLPGLWQDVFNLFAVGVGVGAGLVFNFVLLRLLVFKTDKKAQSSTSPRKPNAGEQRALVRRLVWRSAIWGIFGLSLLLSALARQHQVLSFPGLEAPLRPADPDVWMRLTSVREWLTGAFFDHAVQNTDAPFGGVTTPWTRPLDGLIALFYFFTPVAFAMDMRLMLAATWLPALLCLISFGLMAAAAQSLFRHKHVLACVALLLLGNTMVYDYFAPGASDHHGLLSTLWCGILLLTTGRVLTIAGASLAGVLLGLMVWISPEALILTGLTFALLGGEALFRPEKMRLLATMALGASVMATLGLFVEIPARDILSRLTYDSLSIVQVALLWLTAAGCLVLNFLFRKKLTFSARFCAASIAGSGVLLAMNMLYPRFFLGPLADVDPFIITGFLPRVAEATPLFKGVPEDILRQVMEPALAAVLLACCLANKQLRAEKRRRLTLLALFLAGTFGLTMVQLRWDYYLQPVAIIAAAGLLPGAVGAVKTKALRWLRYLPRGWRPYVCLWALYMAVHIAMQISPTKIPQTGICMAQMRYAIETQQLPPLLKSGNMTVFVPADAGGDMLFFTPFRIIASNYHREGAGLKDVRAIETTRAPEAVKSLLTKRKVSALLYCPGRYPEGSLLRDAAEGKRRPAWMVPVSGLRFMGIPGPVPVLFRVKG
ncbi:MAG: GtrA family protein [Alphaproteobacteria bacterium]